MLSVSLAPTSAPRRWYSKQNRILEEYQEIGYLEAKHSHERKQALLVGFSSTTHIPHRNVNSMEDHSMEDIATQDSHLQLDSSSGILHSLTFDAPDRHQIDINYDDDDDNDDINNNNNNNNNNSNNNDSNDELDGDQSSSHHGDDLSFGSLSYTPHMRRTNNNNNTGTPGLEASFRTMSRMAIFDTPQPYSMRSLATPTAETQQTVPSPDLADFLSPPPTARRNLRQYLDDSSTGFMESEFVDRIVYDDRNDIDQVRDGLDDDDHLLHSSTTRYRRSNFFLD
ncbi:uncharacterized protein BX664DRAFT_338786 [Halteromyces radiatus]|uniref:uncharacterized protein n=1 Tax=Halteromyces radiatus TaxID=101107 RepID=UPI00221FFB1A|nr:uncharacterized protein BX664DRAFT_338786 [Halteromyces radiatus]KAI8085195.1 hypothetical protein BX664DRAFT_338786 [Halteromyces radiatus]